MSLPPGTPEENCSGSQAAPSESITIGEDTPRKGKNNPGLS
jgi:hypothetical protein